MRTAVILFYFLLGITTLYQGSRLTSTVIEKKIALLPIDLSLSTQKKQKESPSTDNFSDSSIALIPLFASSDTIPASTDESAGPQITNSPLLKIYELTGVIYLGKKNSLALIHKRGERESKIYHRGDLLNNTITIIKISRDKVWVNDGKNTTVLPMYYRYTQQNTTGARSVRSLQSQNETYSSSKEVKKILSKSDIENRVFKNVNQILTQIAISPYIKNGKMDGLRLVRVPKNNIIYELGGRSGDIVKRVNGHELNQVDQMYKLWDNIKDDRYISVDLERNRQIYTYNFEIRE